MAAVYGPTPPSPGGLSTSSSPVSATTSSESPRTATSATFPFLLRRFTPETDEIVPKIEELDENDDVLKDGLLSSGDPDVPTSPRSMSSGVIIKRPRGRPRKHPKQAPTTLSKTPKGRSKTGCITCRRRKKKCDETKPSCLHCQKNNVVCEGYPHKDFWHPGKQRNFKGALRCLSTFCSPVGSVPD